MADLTDKKVAILIHNYFEQSEFIEPKEALEQAGAEVITVSCGEETVTGLNHIEMGDDFPVDEQIEDVVFEDYDALVLPGGAVNADNLRMVQKARDWVNYCATNQIPLAVICHAPWVLVSAGLTDGLRLTSYYTIQDDVRNAGGDWVDEEVVIDGSIITSRNPDDIPAFNAALIELIN